ncbi:MAG: MFS transporter [Chloroflexota bacterium]|nr:MFS transporter [Chloroflexota bacterium]
MPTAWVRLVVLWLAGADLRLTLLAVPPVLPLIHDQLGLDEKGVAALSVLPMLLLGAAAVPGSLLIARVGARRALLVGLCLVGCTSALRGLQTSAPVLFGTTLLMGAGIAICQPTMPALVRQWFPDHVARATGTWSNGLLIGELVPAVLTLPLVLPLVGSWQASFVVWSAPVLLTAVLVGLATQHAAADSSLWRGAGIPDWRSRRMWQLGMLQAAASLVYWGANTFIPDYLHATARPELVGAALTALSAGQVPASALVGLVPLGLLARPLASVAVGAAILLALTVVALMPGGGIVLAAGVLGFCAGYILVLALALPALLAPSAEVARLSAGTFSISYSTTFAVTLLAGAAWDLTHFAPSAFLPVLTAAAILVVLAPRLTAAATRSGVC